MNETCDFLPPATERFFLDVVEMYDIKTGQTVLMPFQDVLKGVPIGYVPKISLIESRKTLSMSKRMFEEFQKQQQ